MNCEVIVIIKNIWLKRVEIFINKICEMIFSFNYTHCQCALILH